MYIADKKRFITFLVVCLLSISFIFNHVIAKTSTETNYTYIDYVVTNGETLWTIASKYKADDEDIRNKVAEIKRDNDISTTIYQGQILKIKKEL